MAPTRPLKRQKTNPDEQSQSSESPKPEQVPLPPDTPAKQPQSDAIKPTQDGPKLAWYQSWSRKAAPVTQVAPESSNSFDNAGAETASILSDRTTPRRASTRSSSLAMTLGKTGSTRSLPVDAATSKIHATSDNKSPTRKSSIQTNTNDKSLGKNTDEENKTHTHATTHVTAKTPTKDATDVGPTSRKEQNIKAGARESRQSGWFGWMAKNEFPTGVVKDPGQAQTDQSPKALAAETDLNVTGVKDQPSNTTQAPEAKVEDAARPTTPTASTQKRSWLQMLGGDSTPKANTPGDQTQPASGKPDAEQPKAKALEIPQKASIAKPADQSQASSVKTSPPPQLPHNNNKSAGWVFWSRDRGPRPPTPATDGKEPPHEGEIAISDTPSQHKPKRASISLSDDTKPDVKALKTAPSKKTQQASSIKSNERPQTPTLSKDGKNVEPKVSKTAEVKSATAGLEQSDTPRPASPAPSKRPAEALLLPAFHDTLHVHQNLSLLQQLARLLLYTKEPELNHLSLVKDPPRIRNALAIGVHGYFPGPMVRTLLGQPTGTSIKFADMAAKSIRKWTNSHGYDCEVKTAALEGEGKIAERVDLLWKLLLNWIDEIRKSDFVMVACHSQGVPVAIMLVAKLIQFGCISAARVGICAMAGVSTGPFPELKSRWISGSAGELFDFSDPGSKVSSDYHAAVETILKSGVRLTLIGSIDDQLVSLESSLFAPVTHPHVYRAVLVDSRVHAPGFLSHLVGFVLKLRNLGVQDHGLIRELSVPLAGSLYTGEGHSRIYDDDAVYDMAVSFALETTAQLGVDVTRRNIQSAGGNPYILPFAMRGILEEDFVKSELREEVNSLLHEFDEWKPTTKALKDVKFRLEGVRSKL